jgi:hypothetical protein
VLIAAKIAQFRFNKRRFYNFNALNVNTFPSETAFFFLNPQFPPPKYTISSTKMNNFPHQSGTFPQPKRCRSSSQVQQFPRQNKKQGKKQWGQLFYPFKDNIII